MLRSNAGVCEREGEGEGEEERERERGREGGRGRERQRKRDLPLHLIYLIHVLSSSTAHIYLFFGVRTNDFNCLLSPCNSMTYTGGNRWDSNHGQCLNGSWSRK